MADPGGRVAYWNLVLLDTLADALPLATEILAFQAAGDTPRQIAWSMATFLLTMALLQVPTGLLADKIGRARAIQIAFVLRMASAAIFASRPSVGPLVVGQATLALGLSLSEGAVEALGQDTFLRSVESRTTLAFLMRAFDRFGVLLGICLGTGLGVIDLRIPFLGSVACLVGGLWLSVVVGRTERERRPLGLPPLTAIARQLREDRVRIFRAILPGACLAGGLNVLNLNLSVKLYAIYPHVLFVGGVRAGGSAAAMVASGLLGRSLRGATAWRRRRLVGFGVVTAALLASGGWLDSWIAIPLIVLTYSAAVVSQGAYSGYANDRLPNSLRATGLSVMTSVDGAVGAVIMIVLVAFGPSSLANTRLSWSLGAAAILLACIPLIRTGPLEPNVDDNAVAVDIAFRSVSARSN